MDLNLSISKFKFSKHIAYALSILMVVLILLNWQNLVPVAWPIIILFLFALVFNGGLGGKTVIERIPFYLAVIGFVFLLFWSFLV